MYIALGVVWLLLLAYLFVAEYLISGFSTPGLSSSRSEPEQLPFTLIIPFKNESLRLPELLYSLDKSLKPHQRYEVLFVNDHSEDDSVDLIKNFESSAFKVIANKGTGKKEALETGVETAQYDFICTTDADCSIPEDLLADRMSLTQSGEETFIAGAVLTEEKNTPLGIFQHIESLVLAVLTGGAVRRKMPLTCSGANMSFSKSLFTRLDPYAGNKEINSGDDHFLIHAAADEGKAKLIWDPTEKTVTTESKETFGGLINQRTRWASKLLMKPDYKVILAGMFFSAVHWAVLFLIITCFFGFAFEAALLIAIKLLIDARIAYAGANYYRKRILFPFVVLTSLFYPIYMFVVLTAGAAHKND